MTIDEVEALIKTKTRNKARIHRLEERVGDSVAFLSYSIDDKDQMTIWHTEVPPSLQQMGIGGKLVEEAVQLASRDSSRLRIVCPFAKEHLARHPETQGTLRRCCSSLDCGQRIVERRSDYGRSVASDLNVIVHSLMIHRSRARNERRARTNHNRARQQPMDSPHYRTI